MIIACFHSLQELPKACVECSNYNFEYNICRIIDRDLCAKYHTNVFKQRRPDCPLEAKTLVADREETPNN